MMTNDQYVIDACRTKSDRFYAPGDGSTGLTVDMLHAIVGISTESGELLDAVKKMMFYGKQIDLVNLDEEMGDILWYVAIYCNSRNISLDSLMEQNIAKLRTRFPQAFTEEAANNRDLTAERETLEKHG